MFKRYARVLPLLVLAGVLAVVLAILLLPVRHRLRFVNATSGQLEVLWVGLSTQQYPGQGVGDVGTLGSGESRFVTFSDSTLEADYVVTVLIDDHPSRLRACGFSLGPWELRVTSEIVVEEGADGAYVARCQD